MVWEVQKHAAGICWALSQHGRGHPGRTMFERERTHGRVGSKSPQPRGWLYFVTILSHRNRCIPLRLSLIPLKQSPHGLTTTHPAQLLKGLPSSSHGHYGDQASAHRLPIQTWPCSFPYIAAITISWSRLAAFLKVEGTLYETVVPLSGGGARSCWSTAAEKAAPAVAFCSWASSSLKRCLILMFFRDRS